MHHPTHTPRMRPSRLPKPQQGVALIISLIMLVLMTLVGMAGIRVINAEERMVSQNYDRTVAFQTAEAALREIETRIESVGQPAPVASSACIVTGSTPNDLNICGLIANGVPRWISSTFNEWKYATTINHTTGISIKPEYFVEYLGNDFPCSLNSAAADSCKRYRITARAEGGDGRAAVMLQSIYATSTTTSAPPSGP